MTAARRWVVVALGVIALVCIPVAIGRGLPARSAPISASDLLARMQSSRATPYSGYVESLGTLGLPLSDQFSDLADLFGQSTKIRVWWRSGNDWRVDKLEATGETDVVNDARGTTTWDFESNEATRTGPTVIRLPQASDLLPPALAQQMFDRAGADEVSRLGAIRVAGISAPGLRLIPRDPSTSIARVDVWVEPRTGLPLRIAVYGAGERNAAITSTFDSVSLTMPPARDTTFTPAPGSKSRFEDVEDLAAAANAYAPTAAPLALLGLPRRGDTTGAVGVYGRGVTLLFAIPLRDRVAEPLRAQLVLTPGSSRSDAGIVVTDDPLNLLLTPVGPDNHSWLLAGTVTPATLMAASRELSSEHLSPNSFRLPVRP